MNFAGILAGGKGTRMGRTDLPKQFLTLGTKPIIIHTIEQFLVSKDIDYIIVAVPDSWISYTQDIIDKYCKSDKIIVIQGGADRNDTVMNICKYIKENFTITKDDIVITHDSVRPFITQRIIEDNIKICQKYGATDTVISASDTIVESVNHETISSIPVRDNMYQGQTPQSFRVLEFMDINEQLSDEEKKILTDAAKVYVLKNKQVGLVMGENYNMKITTMYDLKLANLILDVINSKD